MSHFYYVNKNEPIGSPPFWLEKGTQWVIFRTSTKTDPLGYGCYGLRKETSGLFFQKGTSQEVAVALTLGSGIDFKFMKARHTACKMILASHFMRRMPLKDLSTS